MDYNIEKFKEGIQNLGIELDEIQINQFISYYEILVEWNKVMNLTAITEFDEVIQKHFIDSLSIVKAVDMNKKIRLIDIGTGAGFPGIPLKIVFPHIEVVLLDSLNKRINFLNEVIQNLNLEKIKTIHGRAEDFSHDKEYREGFDLCVSRAVANLASLAEYCLPYVKVKGSFVPYKSGKIEEELVASKKAIHVLGGKIENEVYFNLPNSDIERAFVIIRKEKSTPKMYPRKAGVPTKNPIGE
ncbi:16S rRNA (guanine(527)-N(7))-methyltransferase RsmG [Konateibacter massiliensis]|uniref:16S rRNA (guanine(527)-N(7))-methyltransferase RsmG n=1 Tax=Konateibacter massiliensis TaxID=2002841 RepID=UPI000C144894|nr:16S rRNA (guanine(527)-N(7))-methyltransferase RsmG [Konateibacter massiliensis]